MTPKIAEITGTAASLNFDRLPYLISCFISKLTIKKNIAIKKSFTNSKNEKCIFSIDIIENRLKLIILK